MVLVLVVRGYPCPCPCSARARGPVSAPTHLHRVFVRVEINSEVSALEYGRFFDVKEKAVDGHTLRTREEWVRVSARAVRVRGGSGRRRAARAARVACVARAESAN